jgi:hypothetical protein
MPVHFFREQDPRRELRESDYLALFAVVIASLNRLAFSLRSSTSVILAAQRCGIP